jgi:hypothetical protein
LRKTESTWENPDPKRRISRKTTANEPTQRFGVRVFGQFRQKKIAHDTDIFIIIRSDWFQS